MEDEVFDNYKYLGVHVDLITYEMFVPADCLIRASVSILL